MKKNYKCYLLMIFLITAYTSLNAQNRKEKFGKPTLEELKMSAYSPDSSAEAVILFDIGKFKSNDIKFYRHIRLKILKKSGLSWANWTFNTPYRSNFKVEVNTLVDGEVVSDKAKSDHIYEEEVVDNFSVYKVFAPNVKVGSVIDISYSHLGLPSEWRFQDRIPVAYSELKLEYSDFINYSKNSFGLEPIETVGTDHWVARDMPAFNSEPFLSTYKNYITKFQFQLISIGQGMNYYAYSTSWERVIDVLLDNSRFGGILNGSSFLNKIAKGIQEKVSEPEAMIQAAYDSIQSNISWNGSSSILGSQFHQDNFKKDHSGNSADINLMLICLLNKMGIRTFPVALSTRDNGFILQHSPSIDNLNYVIAYVKHNDVEMYIDATAPYGNLGFLPERCLNHQGLMVTKEAVLWLNLQNGNSSQKQYTTVDISEDGLANAIVNMKHIDYSYNNWIKNYKSFDKNERLYLNDISESYNGVLIEGYELVDNSREQMTANEKFELDLTDQLIETGKGYIFTPFVLNDYATNPFKSESRQYPVDMMYTRDFSSTVIINLPEGYEASELPQPIKMTMSDGSATFTLLSQSLGSKIQLIAILDINKYIYTQDVYPELKRFFGEVSRLINQPIEIVKI